MDELRQPNRTVETSRVQSSGRGWKEVWLHVFYGISENRIFLIAAGVTFYGIVALFPGIAAVVSIYGLLANPGSISGHLGTLAGVAPGGGIDVIKDQLTQLTQQSGTALSLRFAVSLVIALWFSNSGMTGLFDALNAVYEEKEQRNLIKYYAMTLTFTVGAIVLVLISIAIIVAIPVVLKFIPNAGVTAILVDIVRWPLLFVLVAAALTLVYRYAPCRSTPQWRWIIWTSCSLLQYGSVFPLCFPGTPRISAATTKSTASSARSSAL